VGGGVEASASENESDSMIWVVALIWLGAMSPTFGGLGVPPWPFTNTCDSVTVQ
jgi:hypothetical protein